MPQALVIGIDRYSAPRIPNLNCAVNDAEEVSARLEAAGFDVVTLTNDGATGEEIESELEVGLNERITDEDDPVLIYWSGHGMTDLREKDDRDRGYSTFLLPCDTDLDKPLGTALAVQHMWALLNKVKTRRLLVLLDTCFSGAFVGGDSRGFSLGAKGGAVADSDDFLQMEGHGRIVVSACGPNEVAREDPKHGHGYFTKALLAAFERGADTGDRKVKAIPMMADVRDAVQRDTKNAQTPSLHVSAQGRDWSVPLPPPATYRPPMPSWAFAGTAGGVGKTTLAMVTAELLAESGNTVLYLDADIAHYGGTSEWCRRASIDIGHIRTFADHVATFSRAKVRMPSRHLSDKLLDVTPEYLRRYDCGKILLLPAARASDKLFVFVLLAEIKNRRANLTCQQILNGAFDRGSREGATCIVIDCGATFDPLAVNSFASAHHPFIVATSVAGAKDKRDTVLSNCAQLIEDFDRTRVETVVNRVPSLDALTQNWGRPGFGRPGMSFHYLPFDRKLFQDWEEGRPNFELGYDQLTHQWHQILVASDRNVCGGLHRDCLPTEWDRFSKWALWLMNAPEWAEAEKGRLTRVLRRTTLLAGVYCALSLTGLTNVLLRQFAGSDDEAVPGGGAAPVDDPSFMPLWSAIGMAVVFGLFFLGNLINGLLVRRRRRVVNEVIKHSVSVQELQKWFSVPLDEGPWWKIWSRSRRAAIEWLHKRVVATRREQLPDGRTIEVYG
ncbi:caspase family protein [Actinomadura soli]|uniref:caspase family protein n=1 Tax=Actinomadura soli TaxID=2508997 RepID=UPI0014860381|nr:caspase family protein [Actinomadura soli]